MYFTANFMNRCRKYRIVEYDIETDNEVVEWEHYWFIMLRNNLYLGHITVALNRLTVFVMTTPVQHAKVGIAKACLWAKSKVSEVNSRLDKHHSQ